MPIGGNAQVTINVGARLQVLQSSVNEIQKVLDKLQPNSAGFKNLQIILNQITKEMDHLQVQTSKPFGSQNQFNQTEKALDKIEDSLNNAQIALGRISFKDLKLTPDQEQQFKDLRNEIAETKKALDSFKNEQKIELFKNADFKKFADSIDSNLIKKNFSEVAQAVSEESERITNEISKLTSKINQASKEISIGENVKNFTGFLDKNKVIKKEFEQFFTQTEQGLKFKPKQQNAFYDYLKEYFSLNDQQLNALKKLSAQKVQEVMTQDGYFEPQLRKAKNAATRQVSYNTQMTELRTQADAAAAAMGTVETAEEKIAEQSGTTEDTIHALEERIRQLELQLVGAAQASPEMKDGIAGMASELNSMKTSLEQANAQFLQLQRQRQTFESIKSGIVNFMGFNQVLNITRNAVRAAIDHIKELDTTMNGIAIVTDMTTADLWKQVDAYSTMAQNFGVTIQGAYEVSKIYYQAGYETNDVLTLTNETLKLSKISGLDYATTTDYMMTAMRGFKLEMEDASRVVDVYSNLAANTAVSQQELAEAMTRTASSMESVGATFEETSAMIATMVAVTRESANNIGSAMKSIASRYGELTKDPAKLLDADGEAMSFNKVDTALRSVGITLQTTDHQFRDFTDVIIELAEKWDTLDSAQQRYIATQFAGNRQQSRFLALVSNIDLLRENMSNAKNSEDIGTLQALKALDSLESKINQVQVAYQQFYTTIGVENVWKGFLDNAKNVIDTLNSLPKVFGKIPAAAVILIMNAIQLIKNALLSGVAAIAKTIKSNLNETETEIEKTVQDAQKQGKTWAENLAIGFSNGAQKLKDTVKSVIDGSHRMKKPEGKPAENKYTAEQGTFLNNWDTLSSQLLPGGLNGTTKQWHQEYENLRTSLKEFNIELPEHKKNVEDCRTAIQAITPKIHEMASQYNESEQKLKQYNDYLKQYDALQKQHQQNVLKAADTYSQLGMGLSSLSLLFNNGTASGRIFSGVMMTLGGALMAVAAGMKAVHGASGWIGLAVTAITTIVSGFATAIESPAETLERLNKEAEELNNKAKEAKANYNTIKRSAEQYTELEKKRYDSAEAADAYQNAVEELADKFPQLIDGINEAGEVSINANNIELELARAREQTANATYEALKAEQKAKIQELENLRDNSLVKSGKEISNRARSNLVPYASAVSMRLDKEYEELDKEYESLAKIEDLNSPAGQDAIKKITIATQNFYKEFNKKLKEKYEEQDYPDDEIDEMLISIPKVLEKLGLSEYWSILKEIEQKEAQLVGVTKAEAAAWIRNDWVEKQETNQQELFEAFNGTSLSQIAANTLQQKYNEARKNNTELLFEDWAAEAEGLDELIGDLWTEYSKLSPETREQFDKLFKNTGVFTAEDIIKKLDLQSGPLVNALKQYYQNTVDSYNKNIDELLSKSKLNGYFDSSIDKNAAGKIEDPTLTRVDWDYIYEATKQADALFNISTSKFKDYSNVVSGLYSVIKNSPEIEENIVNNGLNTVEGINKSIAQLDSNDPKQKEIIEKLQELKKTIYTNIQLTITAATDELLTDWKDTSSKISNLRAGVSFNEAQEFVEKASSLGMNIDYSKAFTRNGDKLILSETIYQEYVNKYFEQLDKQADDWVTDAKNAAKQVNKIKRGEMVQTYDHGEIETAQWLIDILGQENVESFVKNKDFVQNSKLTERGVEELKNRTAQITKSVNDYKWWLAQVEEETLRASEYAIGNYQEDIDTLRKIATNHQLDVNDVVGQETQKSLNDAYSSLISDVMTYGFKNINFDHYTGLMADDQNHLKEMIDSGDYTSFIRYYADFAGKTLEETNALIIQGLEKQQQSTTGAAQDALRDVDFYSDTLAYASRDTIQKLADALGIEVEALLGEYNKELDQYQIQNVSFWTKDITNSADILFDSINSVINSITKYINSGLEGKLSGADVTNLNAQLARYNIDQLVDTDFTRTAEGLKLSETAAFRLYNELKNIDSIQAKITFNDLSKSLQETNENYKSVSDILVRIKDLQKEIADAEAKGDSTRANQYREELSIAKEILAVRSTTDDKSFDFMSGKLPTGLQNPIDYWNSAGKAYKAINEAGKTGYMEIQDYYNIVNEMANLVQLSGTNLEWMGMNAENATTRAAELIQQGFSALSNVDGEGVKISMSKLAQDFQIGAEDMGKNFDVGIKEMARSQIAILDAMIMLLEGIVQMGEALESVAGDDNVFQLNEIFNEGDMQKGFVEPFDQARKTIYDSVEKNKELSPLLETLQLEGHNLGYWLKATTDVFKKDQVDAETVVTVFNALLKAFESNNYDLENPVQSMLAVLSNLGIDIQLLNEEGENVLSNGVNLPLPEIKIDKDKFNQSAADALEKARDAYKTLQKEFNEENWEKFKSSTKDLGWEINFDVDFKKGLTVGQTATIEKALQVDGNDAATEFEKAGDTTGTSIADKFIEAGTTVVGAISNAFSGILETAKSLTDNNDNNDNNDNTNASKETSFIDKMRGALNEKITAWLQKKQEAQATTESEEKTQQTVNENTAALTAQLEQSKKRIDSLESELEKRIQELNQLSQQQDAMATENVRLTEELGAARTELDSISSQLSKTTEDLSKAEKELGQAKQDKLNAENAMRQAQAGASEQVSQFQTEYEQLQSDNETLRENLSRTEKELEQAKQDKLNAEDVMRQAQKDASGQISQFQTEYLQLQSDNETLKEENFEKEKQLADLQSKLQEQLTRVAKLEDDLSKAEKELEEAAKELEDIKKDGIVDAITSADSGPTEQQKKESKESQAQRQLVSTINGTPTGEEITVKTILDNASLEEQEEEIEEDAIEVPVKYSEEDLAALEQQIEQVKNLISSWEILPEDENVSESVIEENLEALRQRLIELQSEYENAKNQVQGLDKEITNADNELKVDNDQAESSLEQTKESANEAGAAIDNASGTVTVDASQAILAAEETAAAWQQAASTISSAANTMSNASQSGANAVKSTIQITPMATGNVALAGGTRQTLMGELGPELYVANGHYYIAGQHGAEFVDLPDNAIVFNHLQTERLLKNGSAGRGKAVTNEHKATSLATGNASGPAMASASAALAALKKIRAMWDAMLHADVSDLGSKAGLGKGGGGGGDKDKGQVVKLDAGYIRDLERWYNLLRQIDRLEQDINYEEKLRAKLQADTVANGKAIYESQRKTYDMLQREIDDRVELAGLKKGYYEQRMAEIQAGPWGQLFYFNEEGVPQMKNLDFLANVFASSEEGGAVHNAREQYAMLQQAGFGQLLQYKEDGSIIEWTDDEGKPREEAYKEAVEAFSAKLDAQTEEVNSLREEYIEEMGTILELQTQQNEILKEIRENTIAVEQEVLKALEAARQAEIDELQKQRDALGESTDRFINGLNDQMNKEREMYNQQESDRELTQLYRQLGILQRSGASATQIRTVQEKIAQKEQDAYFETQQKQIDAIKEASDLQLERLDAQISLMTETLEYQKAHGLLWDQVHQIMALTQEEIQEFITINNPEWWEKSFIQRQADLVELDNKIQQWVAHRDDITTLGETMKGAIQNGIAAITSVVAQVSASQQYTVSGTGSYVLPSESSNSGGNGGSSNAGSSKKSSAKKKNTAATNATKQQEHKYIVSYIPLGSNSMVTVSYSSLSAAQEAVQRFNKLGFRSVSMVQQYKEGGLIDYTGPAWVDGTKKKPEGILNAEQLDMLRNSILTRKNPVAALLADYGNTVSNTANANTYNSIDRSGDTIIENAQVVMNVSKLSNDYDAKQAGKTALEEMLRISRKTKPTSVSRR